MASQSLCNGERAVVLLFISAILFSTPSSLFSQALVLFLLAIAALFLDIRLDNSNFSVPFKTRPGASSGIFLGAVTLPAVMISRLIQLSRAFSLHEVGIKELGYLKVQYWATSASCFGVLIFIFLLMRRSPNNSCSFSSNSPQGLKFSSSCVVSCAVLCCVSFAIISYYGLHTVLLLLWVLFHGVAAAKLIQHVLNTFPSCASIGSVKIYMPTLEVESLWQWFPFVEDILLYILSFVQKYVPHKSDYHFSLFLGEALLVTSGLVLYFGDMLGCTIAKIDGFWIPLDLQYGAKRSEISTIIQGVVLGLLLFPIFFKFLLHIWEHIASSGHSEARVCNEIGKSLIFHTSLAFILIVIIPSWMQFVLDFHMHPLLWIFKFVFSEPLKRLSLCIYWVVVIYASILRFYKISKNSKVERILLRKYYHLMAVSMFLPAVIFQPKFLDLAFGAALAAFLTLEIIRVWRIWPLGQLVHQFMNAFTDHRDSNLLVVSHFSLLLGCALPIWMSSGYNDRPLAPFAGILSLGIGDTMASMVGHKYGVLRWSKTGKKTIEGTAAGITSVLVACSILLPLLASTGYIITQHWVSLLLAVTTSGLLEAYTAQLDNAFIPLIFYSLLCL